MSENIRCQIKKLGSHTACNQEAQPRRIDQKRLWLFFFRISKNGNRRDWEKNRKSMVRLRECVRIVWVKLSSWELGLVWSRGMHCNLKISFIKSASISHGWCVRPWEKNIAADAIIWTYPSLTMYFDILQFRHRLDDSLKHRSLADLIGGPEGSGIWLWPNLSSSATENAKSEVGLLYELARMFCCNLTWIQLPPVLKGFPQLVPAWLRSENFGICFWRWFVSEMLANPVVIQWEKFSCIIGRSDVWWRRWRAEATFSPGTTSVAVLLFWPTGGMPVVKGCQQAGENVDHQFMRHALRSRAGKRVWYLPQSSTTAGMYGKPAVLSGSASVCQRRHWKMQARLQGSSQDKGRLRIFQGEWLLISGR